MKVVFLTQYYPPEMGASPARLSELAKRFVERGHEVFVLTAMPNYPGGQIYPGYGGLFRREQRDGITVLRAYIYPTKSVSLLRRMANYFSFVFSSLIVGSFVVSKVDYLIVESPPLFLGISGYLLSRLKRARWIFNVSDLWPESAIHLGVVSEGRGLQLAWALEAFCYRKAWLVTGQSREILDNIRRRFPQIRTYHLSGGVDTTLFSPMHHSPHARRELVDSNGCIALYAGLHGIAQGLDQVVKAASLMRDLEDLSIVFVGDGPEKEQLIEQAQALNLSNVRFLKPFPREAMPALVASADIAIVPLKLRLPGAVPSKLYEAMGAGLPVVLVADGEAAEIVQQTQSGVVVQPGDIDGLASALRDFVTHPDKRRQAGARGRESAMKLFDRQNIADTFIDHLESNIRR